MRYRSRLGHLWQSLWGSIFRGQCPSKCCGGRPVLQTGSEMSDFSWIRATNCGSPHTARTLRSARRSSAFVGAEIRAFEGESGFLWEGATREIRFKRGLTRYSGRLNSFQRSLRQCFARFILRIKKNTRLYFCWTISLITLSTGCFVSYFNLT